MISFHLYQTWDKNFRQIFLSLADFADKATAERKSIKMQEIHSIFIRIDDIFEQIRQGSISISDN